MKEVHILDVYAKNSGLYHVPELRYAWFCCLTPKNLIFPASSGPPTTCGQKIRYFNPGTIFATAAILSADLNGLHSLVTSGNKIVEVAKISRGLKYPMLMKTYLAIFSHEK